MLVLGRWCLVGGVANANISTGFSRNGIFGMDFLVVGSYRKKRVPDVECISRTSLRNVKEYRTCITATILLRSNCGHGV